MRKIVCMVQVFFGLFQVTSALAIFLDFSPSTQTVLVGQPVSVDVVVSGLGVGGPPSVGAFDLDVSFDPTILSPTGVTFGPFLGDPALFEALTAFSFLPGVVDFAEVSLLPNPDLDALQPGNFTLATLSFNSLTIGTSTLTFSQTLVDDGFGLKLPIDGVGTGSVNVVVPEPSTWLLFAVGLLGIVGMGYRRRKKAV